MKFQTQTGGEQRERDGCPVQERDGQGGEGAPHPRPPPQAAAGQSVRDDVFWVFLERHALTG